MGRFKYTTQRRQPKNVAVVNYDEKRGISSSELTQFVEKAKDQNLYAVYKDFNMGPREAFISYKNIWGDLPPETHIWGANNWAGITPDSFQDEVLEKLYKDFTHRGMSEGVISKALTSTSASVFIPTIIAPGIIDVIKKDLPFLAMTPKRTMNSKTMEFPRRSQDIVDSINYQTESTSDLSFDDQNYGNKSITAKLLFVAGQVTHFAQAAVRANNQGITDLYNQQIEDHFVDLQAFKEKALLRAETSATGTYNDHFTQSNGYDGVIKDIESNGKSASFIDKSSSQISLTNLDKLMEQIRVNNGKTDVIVVDPSTMTYLHSIAREQQRFRENPTGIGVEGRSFMYNGALVIESVLLSTAAGNRVAIAMDITDYAQYQLIPDTFYEVAQDASPTNKFFFEAFETVLFGNSEQYACAVNGG